MTTLTATNRRALAHHEKTIARGLRTFCEVGAALLQIRADDLYAEAGTFEAYCKDRWGFSKTHANRLIDAAVVVTHLIPLTPIGVTPGTEWAARPLTLIRDEEGAIDLRRIEGVWSTALSAAQAWGAERPTTADVEELVQRWKANLRAKDIEPVTADDEESDEEPAGEQLPMDDTVDPVDGECPDCGCYERDDDGGCSECREPCPNGEDDPDEEEETTPGNAAFAALKETVRTWQRKHRVSDDKAAAMCENVAVVIRSEMF